MSERTYWIRRRVFDCRRLIGPSGGFVGTP